MPFRVEVLEDSNRVHAISEFDPSLLPDGTTGSWTYDVLDAIALEFDIRGACRSSVQLGLLEQCWPYIQRTRMDFQRFEGLLRQSVRHFLPFQVETDTAQKPFDWAHNTDIRAVSNILKQDELLRPSKWLVSPNDDE